MTDHATFRSFTDEESATELASWLRDRQIDAAVGDSPSYFDPTFAKSILNQSWNVVLPAHQFPQAERLLADFYSLRIANVPQDYYLFGFSNDELRAIFAEPDNWGDLDKVLAERLLRERGERMESAEIEALAEARYANLAQPESATSGATAYWGYGLCLASAICSLTLYGIPLGVLAILVGSLMARSTKTLPDGRLVDRFDASAKSKGRRIVLLGILAIVICFVVRLITYLDDDIYIY